MRRNELTILVSLVVLALVIAFWLLIISPKRHEAASLKDDVDQLHSSLEQAQQAAVAGDQARKTFPVDYRRLVVLGKAVPADGEQGSLLVQIQRLADLAGVRFQSIDLSASTDTSTAPPTETAAVASTESTPPSDSSSSSASTTSSSGSAVPPPAPAAATEAAAAALPIGASVGPAGLPVMPYSLKFSGGFFQISNFLKSLDGMVHARRGVIDVNGRLLTVDAFSLAPVEAETGSFSPVPKLTADLAVTTYLSPADQGTTAGATPSGPAPATPTPAATTTPVPSSTSTPTASTTP
jgi:type II secretory pathway pseudopilin PulG